jgi:kynureninase
MSSLIIYPQGSKEISVAATESIAVYSKGSASVYRILGYPNLPNTKSLLGVVTAGQTVFGAYASGATIVIEADESQVEYAVGVAPVTDSVLLNRVQGTPGVLNATGALTAAMMLSGIVTSTTAAAVAGTVPTGTVLDAAGDFAIGDSFDWSVIATGANAFTVTADTDHTLVGTAVVATLTSGRFRTRKTAATTFVTYRIA